jgi:hypothetical protein
VEIEKIDKVVFCVLSPHILCCQDAVGTLMLTRTLFEHKVHFKIFFFILKNMSERFKQTYFSPEAIAAQAREGQEGDKNKKEGGETTGAGFLYPPDYPFFSKEVFNAREAEKKAAELDPEEALRQSQARVRATAMNWGGFYR